MTTAAYIFIGLTIFITAFQLALVTGAPWGEYTMGGKFPGKLPAKMRIAALIQIAILILFAVIILSKAGLMFHSFHDKATIGVWLVLAFFIFGTVVNIFSTSRKERTLMGPLNIIALICAFVVAIN